MTYLVTGGAGFIGANFLIYMINKYPKDKFICLDKLTYAANIKNLDSIMNKNNFTFIKGSINNKKLLNKIFKENKIDTIVNFAAETSVDKSISNPSIFIKTNINGTYNLLEMAKQYNVKRFHQISTDEVYGDLKLEDNKNFNEKSPLKPSNPYAVSKAGADMLVLSYYRTYNVPISISRSSNNYGPFQHHEKLIPMTITNALKGHEIPIHGNGKNIRDWIYVEDHVRAIDLIIKKEDKYKIILQFLVFSVEISRSKNKRKTKKCSQKVLTFFELSI